MDLRELNGKTSLKVAGEVIEVNADAEVKKTIKDILTRKGIANFDLIVDGDAITSSEDIPETFGDHQIEVNRQVISG